MNNTEYSSIPHWAASKDGFLLCFTKSLCSKPNMFSNRIWDAAEEGAKIIKNTYMWSAAACKYNCCHVTSLTWQRLTKIKSFYGILLQIWTFFAKPPQRKESRERNDISTWFFKPQNWSFNIFPSAFSPLCLSAIKILQKLCFFHILLPVLLLLPHLFHFQSFANFSELVAEGDISVFFCP